MRADLEIERLEDGCCVLDPRTQDIHLLNRTAAWVLHSCDGRTDTQSLARELVQTVGLAPDVAQADIEACLCQLHELRLLDE